MTRNYEKYYFRTGIREKKKTERMIKKKKMGQGLLYPLCGCYFVPICFCPL